MVGSSNSFVLAIGDSCYGRDVRWIGFFALPLGGVAGETLSRHPFFAYLSGMSLIGESPYAAGKETRTLLNLQNAPRWIHE